MEVVSIEKTTLPASNGLEDELVKLSTNTDETAENLEVVSTSEDREAVAGPGKAPRPDLKTATKKRGSGRGKQQRLKQQRPKLKRSSKRTSLLTTMCP